MSNTATVKTTFRRPEVQRTELGPIFHDVAHKAYDRLEDQMKSGELELLTPTSFSTLPDTLMPIMRECDQVGVDAAKNGLEAAIKRANPVIEVLTAWGDNLPAGVEHVNALTIPPATALSEGLRSGIATPLRLLETVCYAEENPDGTRRSGLLKYTPEILDTLDIDIRDLPEKVASETFIKMLEQLAHAPNAYLGNGSSTIASQKTLPCFRLMTPRHIFEFDDDGHVSGFARYFLDAKHKRLRNENNKPFGLDKYSGGCPVRHAEFKHIGDEAMRYLKEVNDDRRPYHEGESAISRGARLVSFALQHSLEAV